MKKYLNLALVVITATGTLFSCKKDSAPKDYASLFNNTVWTGEFHYTLKTVQPVSIEFKTGGQLTWYELAGEFPGTWKLDNGKITITFPSANTVTADITSDNKLTNMQHTGSSWVIDNAELNTTPDETVDNTKWGTTNLLFTFKAGDKVDTNLGPIPGGILYSNATYTRKAKSIRITYLQYKFFNVFVSTTVMNGINQPTGDPAIYPYKVTKQ